jgi:hypothetical protein
MRRLRSSSTAQRGSAKLSDLIPQRVGVDFSILYDFGDNWYWAGFVWSLGDDSAPAEVPALCVQQEGNVPPQHQPYDFTDSDDQDGGDDDIVDGIADADAPAAGAAATVASASAAAAGWCPGPERRQACGRGCCVPAAGREAQAGLTQ